MASANAPRCNSDTVRFATRDLVSYWDILGTIMRCIARLMLTAALGTSLSGRMRRSFGTAASTTDGVTIKDS